MSTDILISDVIQRERLREVARRSIVPVPTQGITHNAVRIARAVIGRLDRQVPRGMTDRTVDPGGCGTGTANV